jgi:CRISPR-associated endonuclease Cas2
MYVLIVYDVEVKKVTKVHKFLKLHLHWVQNSVFEGELTEALARTRKSRPRARRAKQFIIAKQLT